MIKNNVENPVWVDKYPEVLNSATKLYNLSVLPR
jgi:hypothetical protein